MEPIRWQNGKLSLLDQRRLPHEQTWILCETPEETAAAIRNMVVRGAPAIGITAAFGLVLSARLNRDIHADGHMLLATRPTAVNLRWAVARIIRAWEATGKNPDALEQEAVSMLAEDIDTNRRIGANGAALFDQPMKILTHCNAGALATGGYGTALGVIRTLHEQGLVTHVFADETRPYLQGARLTAFELVEAGIPHSVITDNTAGHLMSRNEIEAVIVGADRIARNGDTANKIGTLMLAICAKRYEIPFYVAAPWSSFDPTIPDGSAIPIEEREREEVAIINGIPIVPDASPVRHIAFDVTPGDLVTGFITERGVLQPPFEA